LANRFVWSVQRVAQQHARQGRLRVDVETVGVPTPLVIVSFWRRASTLTFSDR
jgi:hypothetical protein